MTLTLINRRKREEPARTQNQGKLSLSKDSKLLMNDSKSISHLSMTKSFEFRQKTGL
jgi:hypothetical protein